MVAAVGLYLKHVVLLPMPRSKPTVLTAKKRTTSILYLINIRKFIKLEAFQDYTSGKETPDVVRSSARFILQ